MTTSQDGIVPRAVAKGDVGQPWRVLAPDYEEARARQDSLDHLVEWPAQREMLGDVEGLSVLDLGCGNGGKLAQLVSDGAIGCVGIDIGGAFISDPPPGLKLIDATSTTSTPCARWPIGNSTASSSRSPSAMPRIRLEAGRQEAGAWREAPADPVLGQGKEADRDGQGHP